MTEQHPRPTGRRRRPVRRRREVVPWVVTGVLAVLAAVVWLVVAALDDDPAVTLAGAPVVPRTSAAASPAAPSSSAPPAADLPEGAFAGDVPDDRPYVVGLEVEPGTYRSAGALAPDTLGVWERHRFQSSKDAVVLVANGTSDTARTVALRAGDTFVTRGFQPWHRVG